MKGLEAVGMYHSFPVQVIILLSGLAVIGLYWKRRVWSVLKSRKIVYYSKDTKP